LYKRYDPGTVWVDWPQAPAGAMLEKKKVALKIGKKENERERE